VSQTRVAEGERVWDRRAKESFLEPAGSNNVQFPNKYFPWRPLHRKTFAGKSWGVETQGEI